jgi:hypothetical protein
MYFPEKNLEWIRSSSASGRQLSEDIRATTVQNFRKNDMCVAASSGAPYASLASTVMEWYVHCVVRMEAQPFYKKQERVVKWVMSFVLFRIRVPLFISFFFLVCLSNYHLQSIFYSFSFHFRSGSMWKVQGWNQTVKSQQILQKRLRYVSL